MVVDILRLLLLRKELTMKPNLTTTDKDSIENLRREYRERKLSRTQELRVQEIEQHIRKDEPLDLSDTISNVEPEIGTQIETIPLTDIGRKGEAIDLVGTIVTQVLPRQLVTDELLAQTAEHIDVPVESKKPLPKFWWVIPIVPVILLILGFGLWKWTHPSTSTTAETSTEQVEPAVKTYLSTVQEKLEATAKTSNLPYKIATQNLAGGYILGATVYNPDEPTKLYTDFELFNPESKTTVADDETGKKITDELTKSLPKIGDTIEVKDKDKVTLETYKQSDDTYQTIALFDGKPFAYINTDKEGHHIVNVTSYYVSDVAKN